MKLLNLKTKLLILPLVVSAVSTAFPQMVIADEQQKVSNQGDHLIPATSNSQESEQQDAQNSTVYDKVLRPLEKYFEKAKIEWKGRIVNKSFTSGRFGNHVEIMYHPSIEPAFIQGLQLRLDEFAVDTSSSTSLKGVLGVSNHMGAKVTFARTFENKKEALKGEFYFLNHFPRNAEIALSQLKPGESARLELVNDGSIGKGKGYNDGKLSGSIGASLTKGSRFILDIYRLPVDDMGNNLVRVRVIFVDHDALINLSAGINVLSTISKAANIKLWLVSKLFGVDWPNCNMNFQFENLLPMDSSLSDYVINLNSNYGKDTYNSIMNNVLSAKILNLLSPFTSKSTAEQKVKALTAPADQSITTENEWAKQGKLAEKSTERIFQGTVSSQLLNQSASCNGGLKIANIGGSTSTNQNHSEVQGVDGSGQQIKLIYDNYSNTTNSKKNFLVDRRSSLIQSQVELVSSAKIQKNEEGVNLFVPQHLTDVVFSKDIQRTDLSLDNLSKLKEYLEFTAPELAQEVNWTHFQDKKMLNGYVRTSLTFDERAIEYLSSTQGLITLVEDLTKNYPWKEDVPALGHSIDSTSPDSREIENKYFFDQEGIIRALNNIADKSRPLSERLKMLESASSIPIFREIAPAIIMKSIPKNKIKELVHLRIAAGADNHSIVDHNTLFPKGSRAYLSVKNMMSAIQDRSFDLRLQYDVETGNFKMKKFSLGAIVQKGCNTCLEAELDENDEIKAVSNNQDSSN